MTWAARANDHIEAVADHELSQRGKTAFILLARKLRIDGISVVGRIAHTVECLRRIEIAADLVPIG
jgi:hypothetical protein